MRKFANNLFAHIKRDAAQRASHALPWIAVLLGIFASASPAFAQAAAPETAVPLSAQQFAELMSSLHELQDTVGQLRARLQDVAAAQSRSAAEANQLRGELQEAARRIGALERPVGVSSPAGNVEASSGEVTAENKEIPGSVGARGIAQQESVDDRLARLEENTELMDGKIADQYQSKVESGAKYRLRLSGIFLFNLVGNSGAVNNLDFPELANEPQTSQSNHAFGGSLRQSQLGLEGFGPNFAGAHTSASLRFDFAGNILQEANGALMGQPRLRTGTFRLDWANTSLIAGQDSLFFVPLAPSSMSSLAVPALSYAGNLWGWTPQLRVEHKFHFTQDSALHLSVGVLDQLSPSIPAPGQDRKPSEGEQSGQPGYAAHIGWFHKSATWTGSFGVGGYYGRQSWGFNRGVDSWAATIDLRLPVTRYLEFTSAYYRGRAVGGFGGGVAQSVLFTGPPDLSSSAVRGLDSQGGWAQLTLKLRPDFRINGAFGQDNPFASQLRAFPVVPSDYEEALLKNQSWFLNGIYQLRSNILLSLEFRRFATHDLGAAGYFANNLNLSLGYIF